MSDILLFWYMIFVMGLTLVCTMCNSLRKDYQRIQTEQFATLEGRCVGIQYNPMDIDHWVPMDHFVGGFRRGHTFRWKRILRNRGTAVMINHDSSSSSSGERRHSLVHLYLYVFSPNPSIQNGKVWKVLRCSMDLRYRSSHEEEFPASVFIKFRSVPLSLYHRMYTLFLTWKLDHHHHQYPIPVASAPHSSLEDRVHLISRHPTNKYWSVSDIIKLCDAFGPIQSHQTLSKRLLYNKGDANTFIQMIISRLQSEVCSVSWERSL